MNCHNFAKKIVLQLYGELNEREAAKLNRHLEKCPICRLEMEKMKEIIKVFRPVEMLEPSPSCGEALRRLAREGLAVRTPSWPNRVRGFAAGFAFRMPRPIAVGLSLLVMILALSFSLLHERILLPPREQPPEEIRKVAEWEDELEVLGDLEGEIKIKMLELAMLISEDGFLEDEEEIAELEREISELEREISYLFGERS